MQSHQRYFPLRDDAGRLLPAFLYVGNADPAAAGLVTRGNERVLDGRLDDAEFAYDRDVAEGLETMADRLGDVVFHEKLGSLADKAQRLRGLVAGLAAGPGAAGAGGNGATAPLAETLRAAARLAKADLVSQVVIEFPVLQGVMGGIYAASGGLGERGRRGGGRALPAAVGCGAAAEHPGRRSARRGRQDRQHRRRVGRRPEAVGLPRPVRSAARGHGHRAHRARVRPALPARPGCWPRPSTSSRSRASKGWTTSAGRRSSPRRPPSCASACRCCLLEEGLPFPSRGGGAGRAGRRCAGSGRAGARLRRAWPAATSSRTR